MYFKLLLLIFFSISSQASVWEVEASWFDRDEFGKLIYQEKFKNFIKDGEQFKIETYQENDIKIDCADLATSSYVLFAAIHKLPVLFHGHNNARIHNLIPRFDSYGLLEDSTHISNIEGKLILSERLKAFIDYVTLQTGTYTLFRDSFPIKISKKFLTEGTLYIRSKATLTEGNGHTKIISKVDDSDSTQFPIQTVMVSVPREIKENFTYAPFLDKDLPSKNGFSFRKIYPAIYDEGLPGKIRRSNPLEVIEIGYDYNRSQYSYSYELYKYFAIDLAYKINADFDGRALLSTFVDEILAKFISRREYVNRAYSKCVTGNLICDKAQNYLNWNMYSSPSRDGYIKSDIESISSFILEYKKLNQVDLTHKFRNLIKNKFFKLYWLHNNSLRGKIDEGLMTSNGFEIEEFPGSNMFKIKTNMSFSTISLNWLIDKYSSDPNQHFLLRWGFQNFYSENFEI